MSKIAETYMHLDIRLEKEDKVELRKYLEKQARNYAQSIFYQDVEIVVEIEDGSIKTWVLVGGMIITQALAQYGSVRSGIDYAIKDARNFSEKIMEDINGSGISEREVARFERRLGVPGKLKRLFKRIDKLQSNGRDLSKSEYDREFNLIRKQLIKVFDQIDDQNDFEKICDEIPAQIKQDLPRPQFPQKHIGMPKIALRPEEWEDHAGYLQHPKLITPFMISSDRPEEKLYEIITLNSGIKFLTKD